MQFPDLLESLELQLQSEWNLFLMCCVYVPFNINEQGKPTELKKKYKEKKYYKLTRNYISLCLNWSRDF